VAFGELTCHFHTVFQTVGAAFFLAAAQCAFINQILVKLPTSAPGVNPATLIATGSAQLRSVFTAEEIPGILTAYMAGLNAAFALAAGTAGLAFFVAIFSSSQPLSMNTNTHDTKEKENSFPPSDE
jgi:MFS transporter, DHA2 family, glioxin efflux transporter